MDARYHVCLAVRQGLGPSQRPRTLYLKFLNWPCFTKHPLGPDPDPFHCYCKHLGGKVSAMQMQPHLYHRQQIRHVSTLLSQSYLGTYTATGWLLFFVVIIT